MKSFNEMFPNCGCGRRHETILEKLAISSGAVAKIAEFTADFSKLLIVTDRNCLVYAQRVAQVLKIDANKILVFREQNVLPNEQACEQVFGHDCDCIVAVGSGTINDICKLVSFQQNLPYIIVGTAPSMDGFASDSSSMIFGGKKQTVPARPPYAVICDIDIMRTCPPQMVTAGVGDLIGKYTCLLDWKISAIVNGEYFCDKIYDMMGDAVGTCLESLDMLKNCSEQGYANLAYGLVLAGVAMSFVQSSRPAGGSEHHISHYLELKYIEQNKPPIYHGIKVGMTTFIVLELYQAIATRLKCKIVTRECNPAVYENAVEIIDLIKKLPNSQSLANLYKSVGGIVSYIELGIDRDLVIAATLLAKDMRDKHTALVLASDLGILEDFALIPMLSSTVRGGVEFSNGNGS